MRIIDTSSVSSSVSNPIRLRTRTRILTLGLWHPETFYDLTLDLVVIKRESNCLSTLRAIHLASTHRPAVKYPGWEGLSATTFEAQFGDKVFILKQIDRPLYNRLDTTAIVQEIHNLGRIHKKPYIARLCAVVVSTNPYQMVASTKANNQYVIRGFLQEKYPGGALLQRLEQKDLTGLPWKQWPFQICTALQYLHSNGIAHMDIKPDNVVLDRDGNAVLIDIGGTGAFSIEGLAPELRDRETDSYTLQEQKLSDIWAYGKLLLEILTASSVQLDWLRQLTTETSNPEPSPRPGLDQILLRLKAVPCSTGT
ncbi:hypothetical protein AYO20_00196 [Fonsecaea nubica]|uniref:Protein kinase domain-containing protein n=1 Tax=Fonsecaea nubica TaxID=856822 RepID=A0A178DE28_9EURO|nr:hypothetical protein AYO20_00196 [Fonsecaea nubica]OAL40460.1 hypothetical protein AYO20_00196 [Fonsecaea nubica]